MLCSRWVGAVAAVRRASTRSVPSPWYAWHAVAPTLPASAHYRGGAIHVGSDASAADLARLRLRVATLAASSTTVPVTTGAGDILSRRCWHLLRPAVPESRWTATENPRLRAVSIPTLAASMYCQLQPPHTHRQIDNYNSIEEVAVVCPDTAERARLVDVVATAARELEKTLRSIDLPPAVVVAALMHDGAQQRLEAATNTRLVVLRTLHHFSPHAFVERGLPVMQSNAVRVTVYGATRETVDAGHAALWENITACFQHASVAQLPRQTASVWKAGLARALKAVYEATGASIAQVDAWNKHIGAPAYAPKDPHPHASLVVLANDPGSVERGHATMDTLFAALRDTRQLVRVPWHLERRLVGPGRLWVMQLRASHRVACEVTSSNRTGRHMVVLVYGFDRDMVAAATTQVRNRVELLTRFRQPLECPEEWRPVLARCLHGQCPTVNVQSICQEYGVGLEPSEQGFEVLGPNARDVEQAHAALSRLFAAVQTNAKVVAMPTAACQRAVQRQVLLDHRTALVQRTRVAGVPLLVVFHLDRREQARACASADGYVRECGLDAGETRVRVRCPPELVPVVVDAKPWVRTALTSHGMKRRVVVTSWLAILAETTGCRIRPRRGGFEVSGVGSRVRACRETLRQRIAVVLCADTVEMLVDVLLAVCDEQGYPKQPFGQFDSTTTVARTERGATAARLRVFHTDPLVQQQAARVLRLRASAFAAFPQPAAAGAVQHVRKVAVTPLLMPHVEGRYGRSLSWLDDCATATATTILALGNVVEVAGNSPEDADRGEWLVQERLGVAARASVVDVPAPVVARARHGLAALGAANDGAVIVEGSAAGTLTVHHPVLARQQQAVWMVGEWARYQLSPRVQSHGPFVIPTHQEEVFRGTGGPLALALAAAAGARFCGWTRGGGDSTAMLHGAPEACLLAVFLMEQWLVRAAELGEWREVQKGQGPGGGDAMVHLGDRASQKQRTEVAQLRELGEQTMATTAPSRRFEVPVEWEAAVVHGGYVGNVEAASGATLVRGSDDTGGAVYHIRGAPRARAMARALMDHRLGALRTSGEQVAVSTGNNAAWAEVSRRHRRAVVAWVGHDNTTVVVYHPQPRVQRQAVWRVRHQAGHAPVLHDEAFARLMEQLP